MVYSIISLVSLVSIFVACIYATKKATQISERLKQVDQARNRMKGLLLPPAMYRYVVDLERNCVIVGGSWCLEGGYIRDVNFKEFPFNREDTDDMEFAVREAEELINKLREK